MPVKQKSTMQGYLFAKLESFVSVVVSKLFFGRYVAQFKSGYVTIFDQRWDSRLLYSSASNCEAQQMICFFILWLWMNPHFFYLVIPYVATLVILALMFSFLDDCFFSNSAICFLTFDRRMMVLGFVVRLTATMLFTGLVANFLGFIIGVKVSQASLFGLGFFSRMFCMRYSRYIRDKYVGVIGVAALSFNAFVYQFPFFISPILSAALASLFVCATTLRLDNLAADHDFSVGKLRVGKAGVFLLLALQLFTVMLFGFEVAACVLFTIEFFFSLWGDKSRQEPVFKLTKYFVFEIARGSRQKKVSAFSKNLPTFFANSAQDSTLESICREHDFGVEEAWQCLVNDEKSVIVENFNVLYPKLRDCFSEFYELDCLGAKRFIQVLLRSEDNMAFLLRTEPMIFERWVELLVDVQLGDDSLWWRVSAEPSVVAHPEYKFVRKNFSDLQEVEARNGRSATFFSMDGRSQEIVMYQMLLRWLKGFTSCVKVDPDSDRLLVQFAVDILSKPVYQYPKWQVFLSAGIFKSRWWSNIGTGVALGRFGRKGVDSGYSKYEKLFGGLRGIAARFLAGCDLSSQERIQTVSTNFSHVISPHVLVNLLFLHSQNKLSLDLDAAQVDAFMSVFSSTLGYNKSEKKSTPRKGFGAWFRLFSGSKYPVFSDGQVFLGSVSRIAIALKCFSEKVSLVSYGSPSSVKRLDRYEKICSNFVSMIVFWKASSYRSCSLGVESLLEILKLWKDDVTLSRVFITAMRSYTTIHSYEGRSATQEEVQAFFNAMPANTKTREEWQKVKYQFSHSFQGSGGGSSQYTRQTTNTSPAARMERVNSYNRLIDQNVQDSTKKERCKLPTVLSEVTRAVFQKKKFAMSLLLHPDKANSRIQVPEGCTPARAEDFKAAEKARINVAFQAVNSALDEVKESFGYS